jgi:protein-L-isoaspartate(D-aspartate) O-methyltransferase
VSRSQRRLRLIKEISSSGVKDPAVLCAIENVARNVFVEHAFLDQAWVDQALPIACAQTISQPSVVGLMTQALFLDSQHKVLEIGTGSGYQTAILSLLARRVYTIERHKALLLQAESRFQLMEFYNISTQHSDGCLGWAIQAPFDRILVTAGAQILPERLLEQLTPDGGIIVLPLAEGVDREQYVVKITRNQDDFSSERLFPVRFVPLVQGLPDY